MITFSYYLKDENIVAYSYFVQDGEYGKFVKLSPVYEENRLYDTLKYKKEQLLTHYVKELGMVKTVKSEEGPRVFIGH